MKKRFFVILIGTFALTSAGLLHAQTNVCRDNTGRMYQSSRPCPSPGLIYYGPTERQSRRSEQLIPGVGQAPEHIVLMSPRCASLHDAIRTAPVRGIASSSISDMQREYSRDCFEEERAAREKFYQAQMEKRDETRSAEQAKQQAAQQARMSAEMCGELKRVIKNKRLRTDLTAGELNDLERSEQNYKSRCG